MKVGILTFPNSNSYGAALQMYALYHAVQELGAEAEIVNYHNAYMKAERHTDRMQGRSKLSRMVYLRGKQLLHARQQRGFRGFEKSLRRYPEKPISDAGLLPGLSKRYSHVICGSDQVWNPNITDTDLSYFLNFCSQATKRVSYAPSFGISEFSPHFQAVIEKELRKFCSISVREAEGQTMLEKLLGQDVPLVADPTFLLTKEQWSRQEKPCRAGREPYVLYYTVKSSKPLMGFAKELARKKNMKLLVVGGNVLQRLKNKDKQVDYACDVSPNEWLSLMHHADCVVTNSFHGTAFSIIYERDFYLEFSSHTNSRLRQILKNTGLERRAAAEGCAPWDEHIDYAEVRKRMEPLIGSSKAYLRSAILE